MAAKNILIVEDEPLIAMMLEDFLDELGRVPAGTADSVAAALALLEQTSPDAAIVDVNLRAGEKSWPVADALAARGIPFVLASGGEEVTPAHAGRPRLNKPYTMDAVGRMLDQLG